MQPDQMALAGLGQHRRRPDPSLGRLAAIDMHQNVLEHGSVLPRRRHGTNAPCYARAAKVQKQNGRGVATPAVLVNP